MKQNYKTGTVRLVGNKILFMDGCYLRKSNV